MIRGTKGVVGCGCCGGQLHVAWSVVLEDEDARDLVDEVVDHVISAFYEVCYADLSRGRSRGRSRSSGRSRRSPDKLNCIAVALEHHSRGWALPVVAYAHRKRCSFVVFSGNVSVWAGSAAHHGLRSLEGGPCVFKSDEFRHLRR